MKIWYFVNNNTYILPPQPTYLLPPQIKNIAKYIWLCPPPLLCLLHINVTFTQSPTTPHWPCKVHTHTHQPIPIPQYLFTTNTSATTTHTQPHPHTTTHTPTHTPQHIPLSPPHTPTYIHYPKHPNLHPIPPQTQNTSLQHLQSFQPPPIYLLHSCTVTITLHQHMNTTLNIRTLIKVPFGSYRTNHYNAIRQPLS